MKIGIDMMGGDLAPLEALKGVREYLAEQGNHAAHVVLIGDEEKIAPLLNEYSLSQDCYSVVHAPQVIDMHEHPTKALKEKKHSSIAVGFGL